MYLPLLARGKFIFISVVLVWLQLQTVQAQVFPIKFYNGDENCSLLNAQCISQDSRGILWVGTAYRLAWYDGSHFKNQVLPLVAGQLYVTNIVNDNSNQVWITTFYNGLYRYDGKTYHNYLPDTVNVNANSNNVFDIAPLSNSTYAVATDGNVLLFNGTRFSALDTGNADLNTFVGSLAVDKIGQLFIATSGGVIVYRYHNNKLSKAQKALAGSAINKIEIAADQSIWILTDNGLLHYANAQALLSQQGATVYFKNVALTNFSVSDNTANVTTTTAVYQIANGVVSKMDLSNHLYNDAIRNVFTDSEKNNWVVLNNGIAKIASQNAVYYSFAKQTTGQNIHDIIAVNDSTLLVATDNGMGLLNTHTVSVTPLPFHGKFQPDFIFQLLPHQQKIYAATSNCIATIDPATKKVNVFKTFSSEAMYKANDSTVYFSGANGSVGILQGESFKVLSLDTKIFDRVSAISCDAYGRVWLGCWNKGLYVCQRKGDTLFVVKHFDADNGFKNLRIRSLLLADNGLLYAGTRTQGIYVFDTKTPLSNVAVNYTETNGLEGAWVKQIKKFGSKIYAATNEGVFVFMQQQTPAFEKISDNDFNVETNSFFLDRQILYRGTQNGIVKSSVAYTVSDTLLPVYISNISINGKTDSTFASYQQHYQRSQPLQYYQNNIAFDFTALYYKDETKVRYQYRLLPQQTEWSLATSANFITYPQLPPNSYTFEVKASSNQFTWSKTAVYQFEVLAPFYRTTWFYFLLMALLGLLFYSYYRMRIKQIEAMQKVRNRIARDLHDDVGSALSTINIFSAMAKQNFGSSPQKAELLVGKISETSQHMLYNMHDIVWSISPKNDTMQSIVARMREYASSVCEAKNIEAVFDFSTAVSELHLDMNKRYDLLMIFKEAVNNSVKYAGCTRIIITLNYNASLLHLEVSDNGCGFDSATVKQGNGLANMQQRGTNLKGTLVVTTGTGRGCSIKLQLPV